jgi:polysaccharide chain length determinant protein (PEP-CTERM system associated)
MDEIIRQAMGFVRGMWRFRWYGLIASWIVAIIGVAAVFRIPDAYEASARLYVDTDSVLKPLMSGMAIQPNVEQQLNMLTRTLLSRPNIEKLVRMADLDLKGAGRDNRDALVDKLMGEVQIRAASGLNLYTLVYRDNDQDKAKRVIQSLVSLFVESSLGSSRKGTDTAKTFLDEQIKAFELKLEEAETRVKEFRIRNLSMQNPDGKDATGRLAEANAQLESAKLMLVEAERARDAAKQQLVAERGQTSTNLSQSLLQESTISVATPELDSRIEGQRRNLDGLMQRFTDQHPDVIVTKRLLKDLEDQRRKEVQELRRAALIAAGSGGGANNAQSNAAVQELNRIIASSEIQVATLRARVSEYSSRFAQAREGLKTAPQLEAEAAQLNRDYGLTKKSYEDLVGRRQTAVMSGELDAATGVAEFRLIDPPRVSPKPVYPNRIALLPMALVAGLAAGLALALALSQLRPTFDDPSDLHNKTGLPLLGVVTMVLSDVDRRRERMGHVRFMSASGSLVGLFIAGLIAMSLMGKYAG